MKVTILEDFRSIKKDTVYEFGPYTVLVGENGCGKSSLLQAIRASLEGAASNQYDLNHIDRKHLANKVKVESEYDKLFVFDTTMDRANSMNNGVDAYTWLVAGGMAIKDISNGQIAQHYAVDIFQKIEKYRKENPIEKILVILDELDTGFSIRYQKGYHKFCSKLIESFNCDLIVVSHSYYFLNQQKELLVFEDNRVYPSGLYLAI